MNRRAQLLSANDSVEEIEALIGDSLFEHIYWAHFDLRGKDPANPMPFLWKTFVRLAEASGGHVWPFVVGTALPWKREHAHAVIGCDIPIEVSRLNRTYKWGGVVCGNYQPNLGGVAYILTGHIQQPPFHGIFCPTPHACGQSKTDMGILQVCKHQKSLPLSRRRHGLYSSSRAYRALSFGQHKAHGLGHLLNQE